MTQGHAIRTGAVRAALGASLLALCASCGGGGGGGGGGGVPTAQNLASVDPNPVSAAENSNPGDFAADLLRSLHFTELLIEVDYPESRPPSQAALDLLVERLEQRCDKPGGITVDVDDEIPDAEFPATSSIDDLDDLVAAHRDEFADQATGVQVIYVLYALGLSDLGSGPQQVVGLSWHGATMAVFTDVTDEGTNASITAEEVEGSVLVHEAGHLLGLVNSGVPMTTNHEDDDHEGHDDDANCVMYWLLQIPVNLPNIGDPDFATFDDPCMADVEAFGGLPAPTPLRRAGEPIERVTVGVCPGCRHTARR